MRKYIKITASYDTTFCELSRENNIESALEYLDVLIVAQNSDYKNFAQELNTKGTSTDPESYTDLKRVNATGYSQSEWQNYEIWYNESDVKNDEHILAMETLVDELKKTINHFNE